MSLDAVTMEIFSRWLIIIGTINLFRAENSFHIENHDIRDLLRKKRALLFPNPLKSETKVQVLFGLGLPMEGEVSMTLGYVLKCNYRLPYNASTVTNDGTYVRHARADGTKKMIKSLPSKSRKIATISRWSLYRMLEMLMENEGSTGKACMLRAICEAAEVSFRHSEPLSLLSEILHALLTPSTTNEEYEMYWDREYHIAELIGKDSRGETCRMAYGECRESPLNYFTMKR